VKTFTFFYDRYSDATTSKELYANGIKHYVMIHSEKHLTEFNKHGTIKGKPVVTNEMKGLANQRNRALDMVDVGEWCVFMCDDFVKIKSYPQAMIEGSINRLPITFENQNKYRLKDEITLKQMFTYFPRLIQIAEKNKIHLIGFGLHDNPMNLGRKFTTRGLADGRFWLIKKSNYNFDLKAQLIDDVAWTAENLVRHGNVLVLNWVVPYFKRYSSGGFGSTSERIAQRKKECGYLSRKYDPLVRIANKPNWEYGTHIRIYGASVNIMKARKNIRK
jgi:hypothetical protein